MKKKLTMIILFLLIATSLLVGCSKNIQENTQNLPTNNQPTTTGAKTISVSIIGFQFNPSTIEINKGDTVIWTNEDSAPHTVTSAGFFDSGNMVKGQTYIRTFNEAGTFDYICTYHPSMLGKVVVT